VAPGGPTGYVTAMRRRNVPLHAVWLLSVCAAAWILCGGSAAGVQLPPLRPTVNDLGGMMPATSLQDLEQRLVRFKARTGHSVVVLTLPTTGGADIDEIGRSALQALPLSEAELRDAVVLVVARRERLVTLTRGPAVEALFPQPAANQKLFAHVSLYFDGLRPDLGIYGGVNYIFRAFTGEVRVESTTDEEKLENSSITGRGAGAIFTLCLAPYLSLFVGMLWGIYATKYAVQRGTRVFIGAVLGSGTAKLIATGMASLGSYGYDLWYFILTTSIVLAAIGSYTEFWMSGDWCAIPRIKDRVKRKPEDNMGI
jgi:uncharacterized membrane protein YgcG